MDTATAAGFRALRRLEFELCFRRRLSFEGFWAQSVDRWLLKPGLVLFAIALIGTSATIRGSALHWDHVSDPVLIIVGTLWGLAGLIPLVGAILATMGLEATTGLEAQYQPTFHPKPFSDLLPLTERQGFSAKVQGRLLAFVIYLAAGLVLMLATRQTMASFSLVSNLPGLLDPWHVSAIVIFAAFTLAGVHLKMAWRRVGPIATVLLFNAYAIGCVLLIWAGVRGLYVFGQWNIVAGAAILVGHIVVTSVVADLLYRVWRQHAQARSLDAALARPRGRKPRLAFDLRTMGSILEFETATATAIPGMARYALRVCLRLALWIAAVIFTLQGLISALMVLYATAHGMTIPAQALRDVPQGLLGMGLIMLVAVVAMVLPTIAWSEAALFPGMFAPQGARTGLAPTRLYGLLPLPPRRRWWRRLLWLIVAGVVVEIAALLAAVVVAAVNGFAAPQGLHVHPFRLLLIAALPLVAAVGVFAYAALLGQTNRNLRVSGCLIQTLVFPGLFAAIPLAHHHPGRPPSALLPVFALAWFAALILTSLAAMEPSFWPRRPDGSRSLRTTLQAVAITLSVPVTIGLGTRLFMALVMGGKG